MIIIPTKKLFLIDALGAVLSSFSIGFGSLYFSNILGMPNTVLTILTIIPVFYFFYSFINYIKARKNKKLNKQLRTIAFANLTYSILTLSLLFYYFSQLSVLEITYFILEIIVLICLTRIELKSAKN